METSYSYFCGDNFMSCKMLFVLAEEYAEFSCNKKIWELLGIRNDTWSTYKRDRKLPLKQYKKLCEFIGIKLTDDDRKLCEKIFSHYFDEKEVFYV
jgi:hypothetical protein